VRPRARGHASVVAFADASTRLLIGPKDTHRFGIVERSAFILPAADGRAGHSIAMRIQMWRSDTSSLLRQDVKARMRWRARGILKIPHSRIPASPGLDISLPHK